MARNLRVTAAALEQAASNLTTRAIEFGVARSDERFWRRYLRAAFLVLSIESVGILAYVVLSPIGPHGGALEVIAAVSSALALGVIPWSGRIALRPWRSQFSLCVALGSGIVLAVCCHLDGGLDSPLPFLFVLPIANVAVGLSLRAVALCTAATVVEFVTVAATDRDVTSSIPVIVLLTTFLAGSILLAWGLAISRARLDEDRAVLLAKALDLANTDMLTGCLNHGGFFERLDIEIDRAMRHGQPLSLLIADVDLFKAFNDAHGHAAGDEALRLVGSVMRETSRSYDIVGRVGGDEFAVILPATAFDGAQQLAERMSESLKRPGGLDITASVGYAVLDHVEPTQKRLFRDADSGLYLAKVGGRARAASPMNQSTPPVETEQGSGVETHHQADLKLRDERVRATDHATAEAIAILDTLNSTDSVGFAFIDPHFRLIRMNPMFAAVSGGRVEDQLGQTVAEVVPHLWPVLEPAYRAVLETGEALTNQEVVGATASDPGHPHHWLANFYPVKVHGDTTGICVVALDITDRKDLEQSHAALTRSVVAALAASVELRDPYTAGHQLHVAQVAVAIATELRLDSGEIDAIGLAAGIHDVGKLAVPAEILARPGRLNDAEMELVRGHAQAGSDLLESVDFPDHVREMILQHHERLDGSGYPRGLYQDQISIGARIIAVADVVESMSSHRPYRAALGVEVALKESQKGSGSLYDPDVVAACLALAHDDLLALTPTAVGAR